jgi:queuosine precursor transporter
MKRIGIVAVTGYIATIFLANWLIQHVGIVSVGFGLMAPAGVYAAGLALTLRDIVQEQLGRPAVLMAIVVGAALSWFVAPSFAVASAVAFLVSELADFGVYTPLREHSWAGGVLASNVVGAALDSWLFLTIAFGSTALFWGQFVGKIEVTLVTIALLIPVKRALLARHA